MPCTWCCAPADRGCSDLLWGWGGYSEHPQEVPHAQRWYDYWNTMAPEKDQRAVSLDPIRAKGLSSPWLAVEHL